MAKNDAGDSIGMSLSRTPGVDLSDEVSTSHLGGGGGGGGGGMFVCSKYWSSSNSTSKLCVEVYTA